MKLILTIIFTLSLKLSFTQVLESTRPVEIPVNSEDLQIVRHAGFTIQFDPDHKQAVWVAYELTSSETNQVVSRTDNFRPDPKIMGSATDRDYKGSGYDRGHLAPAADMGWSSNTMSESFYYSNMSPQLPGFNRGIWKKLESLVRTWAQENGALYVVTGPILEDGLSKVPGTSLSIPRYYYKAILDLREPEYKAIGFVMPNMSSKLDLKNYTVTIDSLEVLTGLDFFVSVSDSLEDLLEKQICLECWSWTSTSSSSSRSSASKTVSVQCKGITKAGERCKNKTTTESGYCYIHENAQKNQEDKKEKRKVSVQCSGTTKAGTRCKRKTYSPNGRCFQHGGN